ncbi:MAG: hypothetical protein KAS32_16805, partial [Candidatus Peribacteraceae bacterium]|nr:hypothetical protein [Candidatus Peribacteraceae bacterium]
MRIIDKRTDYYDNVVPFSPEPVWVRKEIEFRLGKDNPFKISKDHIDRLLVAWDSVPTPRQYRTYPHAMVCVGGRFYIIFYGDGYLGRPQDIISADRPSKFVKKWNDHHKDKSKHIKIDKDGDGYFYWKMQMFNDKNIKQWYSEHRYMSFTKDLHLTFRSPLFMITRPH